LQKEFGVVMKNDFDLANESRSAFATFEEATHYLEDVCARLKVNHLSYWLVHSIDGTPDQVTWITTYDPSYMSFYMANYTPLGDSSFETALAENQVLDWADDDSTKKDLLSFEPSRRPGLSASGSSPGTTPSITTAALAC
jgi:hypothetical protein